MNNVAVAPYIAMHALQIQNVKRNVVKKVSVDDINNEISQQEQPLVAQSASPSTPHFTSESTSIDNLPVQVE